ncbi:MULTISPECIES: hypothetical protein [Chloracidobacterium]|jgi:hypothetical protein|uniref:hypothetical protein n=1 Tax=Chloracidobacterium TaxID=458032 RepID=UPI0011D1B1D7|nr:MULTISPECIES: hypothetical protein [Chloracidobacterium]QUV77968.1 hypothetical protein J8C08_07525 [Chloracidobacterium thermophilum]QUV81024.1 hypothetical protein J8C01_07190 [Chloracidobacterium sp. D]
MKLSLVTLIILVSLFLSVSPVPLLGQGSVGVGRAPRTASEVKRNLKTILIVKSVNPDLYTIEATDEITGDELTYRVSRNAKIGTEKGFPILGRSKEIRLADIKPGQRLEVVYRESLPTQLTRVTLLRDKTAE